MAQVPPPRIRFLKGIATTVARLMEDQISDLVVTMASAVPYALVMRELIRLGYPGHSPVNFLIYDPGLHPQSERPHRFTRNRDHLNEEQLTRLSRYFAVPRNRKVGVFDEAGFKVTGQSIQLAQEQIARICGNPVKYYTCGKKGLLASRNAESINGKLLMRDEEFIQESKNGRRKFLGRDIKSNIHRSSRKQFSSLDADLLIQYTEFRGCWKATGKCAKIMMAGYNRIAAEINQLS